MLKWWQRCQVFVLQPPTIGVSSLAKVMFIPSEMARAMVNALDSSLFDLDPKKVTGATRNRCPGDPHGCKVRSSQSTGVLLTVHSAEARATMTHPSPPCKDGFPCMAVFRKDGLVDGEWIGVEYALIQLCHPGYPQRQSLMDCPSSKEEVLIFIFPISKGDTSGRCTGSSFSRSALGYLLKKSPRSDPHRGHRLGFYKTVACLHEGIGLGLGYLARSCHSLAPLARRRGSPPGYPGGHGDVHQ